MREIGFRGLSIEGNIMVYGDLLQYRPLPVIFDEIREQIEVGADTVGQLTGMIDINGEDIYEGDVAKKMKLVMFLRYFTKKGPLSAIIYTTLQSHIHY